MNDDLCGLSLIQPARTAMIKVYSKQDTFQYVNRLKKKSGLCVNDASASCSSEQLTLYCMTLNLGLD